MIRLVIVLKHVFLILLLLSLEKSYAQITPLSIDTADVRHIVDSIDASTDSLLGVYHSKVYKTGYQLMPSKYFDKFMNKYFSYLSFDKEEIPPGNSISLKPTSSDTRLLANLTYKRGLFQLYSFGSELDYSDNVGNIISGKDFTSNTSFFFNFAKLNSGARKIWYDPNRAIIMNNKKIAFVEKYQDEVFANYNIKFKRLFLEFKKTDSLVDSLAKIRNPHDSTRAALGEARKLKYELKDSIAELKIPDYNAVVIPADITEEVIKYLRDTLKTKIENIEINTDAWTRFQLSWFSGGIKYTREAYKTYDSLKAFSNRIEDFAFDKWSLNVSYNFIRERSKWYNDFWKKGLRSFYLNAGYKLSRDNNYTSIDEQDILTSKNTGSNDTTNQLQNKAKVRNISGATYKTNWAHQLGINATLIFAKSNVMGLNLGINTVLSKFQKPLYNSKIGLLLRFKDSADSKSKINFEIFLQLEDLADNKDTGKSPWQRKVIGINTAIPFSTIFFK